LRLYFREDDAYQRLCISSEQAHRLDDLWRELRVISQWPAVEARNYPSFFGFVTQETTKQQQDEFDNRTRAPVFARAEQFERELAELAPVQLTALVDFAAKAYRRPLEPVEQERLRSLYTRLREKDLTHEDAFRTVLAGVLVSPAFLYRGEAAVAGAEAQPVSSWELATRLSYFLWASAPDDELRKVAAAGQLTDPTMLAAQTERMLRDAKTRGIALEFGAQWLHARSVRDNHEKNEKLFPTFDDNLRQALLEETVSFFADFFQQNRSTLELLDADYTFLNESLAKHYEIPGVSGPAWRRVEQVKPFGRGGVLALGSVLTQQSGASRSSPVLRGNWVVEALLGERIPKPPPDVPRLPEEETGGPDLSVRQMVEKHASIAACANCHQRFDPFETRVELRDGAKFDGLDGLRNYLLTQRKADFLRHFCKKLLGYALGRTVSASDQPLIDEMIAALESHDYRIAAAVQTIVASPQFRNHRGLDATKHE
jgi:rubrerythrin